MIGDNKVGQYKDAGFFGELALMYNMPRAATITAVTEGTLWSLVSSKKFLKKKLTFFQDRKTFRQIIVKANAVKRAQFEEFLKSVEILENINVSRDKGVIPGFQYRNQLQLELKLYTYRGPQKL